MPTFAFTSPDGKRYRITGPEGATPEQAFQILQGQIGGGAGESIDGPATPTTPAADGILDVLGGALNTAGDVLAAPFQSQPTAAELLADPARIPDLPMTSYDEAATRQVMTPLQRPAAPYVGDTGTIDPVEDFGDIPLSDQISRVFAGLRERAVPRAKQIAAGARQFWHERNDELGRADRRLEDAAQSGDPGLLSENADLVVRTLFGLEPDKAGPVDPNAPRGPRTFNQARAAQAARDYAEQGEALRDIEARATSQGATGPHTAYSVLSILQEMAPALAAGPMGPGGTSAAAVRGSSAMMPQVGADVFAESRGRGLPMREATQRAGVNMAQEGLSELLPLGVLFSRGTGPVMKALGVAASEGGTESAGSLVSNLYDMAKVDPDMTLGDALAQAGYEGLLGALGGGAMGGAFGAVEAAGQVADRRSPQVRTADAVEQWARAIEELETPEPRTQDILAAFAPPGTVDPGAQQTWRENQVGPSAQPVRQQEREQRAQEAQDLTDLVTAFRNRRSGAQPLSEREAFDFEQQVLGERAAAQEQTRKAQEVEQAFAAREAERQSQESRAKDMDALMADWARAEQEAEQADLIQQMRAKAGEMEGPMQAAWGKAIDQLAVRRKSAITPDGKTGTPAAVAPDQSTEVRTLTPVAESQAPATSEPGEGGVATAADRGASSTLQTGTPATSPAAPGTIAPMTTEQGSGDNLTDTQPLKPESELDDVTGLPLNSDGTVTVYHHTSADRAQRIRDTGILKADAEPDVYVTTRREADTGYGDSAVAIRVNPDQLQIDDEFPDGRRDFRLSVGRPGGSIQVIVENPNPSQRSQGAGEQTPSPKAEEPSRPARGRRSEPAQTESPQTEQPADTTTPRGGGTLYANPFQPMFDGLTSMATGIVESPLFDELRFKAQDKFHYLNKAQKAAAADRGLTELPEAEDAYLAELRYHGMAGAAIEDFQRDHIEPLTEAISKAGVGLEDVDLYLWARHAPEANKQLERINPDRPDNQALSGMSNEEAAAILARLDSPAMQDIAQRVDAITAARRKLLVDAGLETQETVDKWVDTYQHYVPLKREGHDGRLPPKGRGFDTRSKEKRRAGSTRGVVHVLANVVAQYEATAIKAEKVKVGRAFLEFARNNPNPELYEIDKVEYKPTFDADGLVQYRPDPGFALADNVLVVRVDGVNHRITFNEQNLTAMRMAHALNNLGDQHSGPIVNALRTFTRWLAIVNTSANPEFVISNFARDLQTAGYNLTATEADKLKWKIIRAVGTAWRGIRSYQGGVFADKTHPWAQYFDEFRKAGAQTGWLQAYSNIEDREKALIKQVRALGGNPTARQLRTGLKAIIEFVEKENTAVENAIRLSAFVHARQAGLSEAKAARIAKEMTVNFNRKGDMGQVLNALYLFYNASVQGSVRLLQAFAKSRKVRMMAGATVAFAAILDMVNRALGGDDEDGEARYDKIPDFVKERNLIIMLPSGEGDYIKIPLPWGYNVLHVMGQAAGEAMTKEDFEGSESAARVAAAMVGAFNPIGSEASILQMISPTITDPIVQWAENKDWSGRPLRPSDIPFGVDKPNSQKYFGSVREPSRWAAEQLNAITGGDEVRPGAIDISPEAIDLAIDTFTGGAGRFISDLFATPIKAVKGEPIETYEIPLLRKLYGKPGVAQVKSDYYERAEEIALVEKQLKHYRGDREKIAQIRRDHAAEIDLIGNYKSTDSRLRKLRKRIRYYEKEGDERAVKEARERELEIMQRFNKAYNAKMKRLGKRPSAAPALREDLTS